jgi:hypothetical protein
MPVTLLLRANSEMVTSRPKRLARRDREHIPGAAVPRAFVKEVRNAISASDVVDEGVALGLCRARVAGSIVRALQPEAAHADTIGSDVNCGQRSAPTGHDRTTPTSRATLADHSNRLVDVHATPVGPAFDDDSIPRVGAFDRGIDLVVPRAGHDRGRIRSGYDRRGEAGAEGRGS